MLLRVHHKTAYSYSEPVSLCHSQAHLFPRATPRQRCVSSTLAITPAPDAHTHHTDYFGNRADCFTVQAAHRQFIAAARSVVEVGAVSEDWLGQLTPPWEQVALMMRRPAGPEALEGCGYIFDSPLVRRSASMRAFAEPSFPHGRPILDAVIDLTSRIHAGFKYVPGATLVTTPVETVMQQRQGVCQDLAHVMIGCLRAMGLAARYVSGYLMTAPPPGQAKLVGADASHAWVATYCPPLGWIDLDPTNNLIPSEKHVTVAWGRDYGDVTPLKGVILGGGQHAITISVDVDAQQP